MMTLIGDALGNTHHGDEITDLVEGMSLERHGNRLHGHGNVVMPFLTGRMVHSEESRLTRSSYFVRRLKHCVNFFGLPAWALCLIPNLIWKSTQLGSVSGSIWCSLLI
jgi:hypothetical protein